MDSASSLFVALPRSRPHPRRLLYECEATLGCILHQNKETASTEGLREAATSHRRSRCWASLTWPLNHFMPKAASVNCPESQGQSTAQIPDLSLTREAKAFQPDKASCPGSALRGRGDCAGQPCSSCASGHRPRGGWRAQWAHAPWSAIA